MMCLLLVFPGFHKKKCENSIRCADSANPLPPPLPPNGVKHLGFLSAWRLAPHESVIDKAAARQHAPASQTRGQSRLSTPVAAFCPRRLAGRAVSATLAPFS